MASWKSILGSRYGILQAPLGPDISGPDLVSAVSNAGGFGFLRAPDKPSSETVKSLIKRTRELTHEPFGVAFVLHFPQDDNIQAALDEKVGALWVSFGEFPKEKVAEAHKAGVKVVHQVASVEEATKAAVAGVDVIVVQGVEAGGHLLGKVGLLTLLPAVVDALRSYKVPIVAAGGIVDARGYVAALALGAQGVALGTRFLATLESFAHAAYKKKIVELKEGETEYTDLYGRLRWFQPHRVIRTSAFELLKEETAPDTTEERQPTLGQTTIYGQTENVPRLSGKVPNATTTGDLESMAMYAGAGSGLIQGILPAGQVVAELVEGAKAIIQQRLAFLGEFEANRKGLYTMV